MDAQMPLSPATSLPANALGRRCRLCGSGFRRRSPGQKYCERCRARRSSTRTTGDAPESDMDVACTVKTMTYRVHTSALGLLELDGERIPVTIPANSYINAEQPPADGDKKQLVDVVWRGTALTMFACD